MNDENNIDNIKNTNKKNTLNEEKIIKIEEFNEKLMSIYTDVDARFNYQNWECIFNKYLNENNENISKSLEKSLLNFLFTYKYVPYEV